jgi:hypothetical protein
MKITSLIVLMLTCCSAMAQLQQRSRPAATPTLTPVAQPVVLQKIKTPVYDFSTMELCVDRPPATGYLPPRDFSAVAPPPKINSDGSVSNIGVSRQPLAGETNKMWDPGQTISVYLNTTNGSDFIRNKVKEIAREWERIANIKFAFVNEFKSARVKVMFGSDNKNWSWIGKDVLFNPIGLYTMHFGSFSNSTGDGQFRRLVLHEFGHALGFIHEHQSPAAGIQWDKEKVYAFYAAEPNKFSRVDTDINVFNKYANTNTNYSAYDPYSIMHYAIPPDLTLDGRGTPSNASFSYTDIEYARRLYPFPVTDLFAAGTLRTGDDCDQVDFKIEYNVLPADQVEFTIELGQMDNKKVTWWKQIAIPLINGESKLWVQDHSLIASENRRSFTMQIPFADLKKGAPIAFWKAKMLGVHTLLPFKWSVLHALKGGCRVKLIWKDDSCS